MKMPLQRVFTAILVALLLICSVTVAATAFHEAAMVKKIADVQANLDAVKGRLRKQQQEYTQVVAELPQVQSDLAALQPQAAAAYEQEQALRQQRKELRAESALIADELAALLIMADEASADALRTSQAIDYLTQALTDLFAVYGLQ